ncbi:MAG: phosphoribosyltransferase [Aliivibrio sp.]|uniref:phosphoribosyltransferase n=1 Tax=Aliivibrio sp. TaxID=1872443 RepID=UPI001A570E67|nr:phosphoribosyltransferase [Aliivibrio sp.]
MNWEYKKYMGFRITENGSLILDHSINTYGNTCPSNNPTVTIKKVGEADFNVHSIFSRKFKAPKNKRGDNCPFIYAYKGKEEGLNIGYRCAKDVMSATKEILPKFFDELPHTYDLILSMPSKHNLVRLITRQVKLFHRNAALDDNAFRKATNADVLAEIDASDLPYRTKSSIRRSVKKNAEDGQEFSIGNIGTGLRRHITPLFIDGVVNLDNIQRILLVDDLVSTGQTLVYARQVLLGIKPELDIEALALFGPFGGRFR